MSTIPKTLYRYRPLEDGSLLDREIEALKASYLWSPKFSEMNDPMEAYYEFGDENDALLDLIAPGTTARLPDLYGQMDSILKSLCLISCTSTHTDPAMWAYYGSNHAGMCLEFDTQILELGDLRGDSLVSVTYGAAPLPALSFVTLNEMSFQSMVRYVSHKRIEWKHEAEWRYVTGSNGKKHYLEDALSRVYIGARASKSHCEQILAALKNRPVEVVRCHIRGFDMAFETIQEATPIEKTERVGAGRFEPEKVLSFVENDLRKFLSVPYDELLAECARTTRHPNVEEILSIDVAGSNPDQIYFWTLLKLRSGREIHEKRYFDRHMKLVDRKLAKP